ncbi:Transcription coactivator [Microbotryum lychnidis-dioicae p1A1 Lamole]|uniref:Transcription coactivator n=1 Tax=Microbotryum lychnidis-dioicae (strain p1A1 Lamole / MvSl-1064) TaxID=683840 RepID=U5H428_USTV1|nr:Transcription coactivator [Microbotryum lychnidis-dioicae p1A1 Lamole]|eukprot:KDE07613.1 Transcription coactivator [Microbotryum lychnidis-dioicae p1A1 Lamole]
MTVTKRKQKPRDTGGPDAVASIPALESGMKASCDSCSADITHSVHVRCAETLTSNPERLTCPDFDLCVPCFLSGKAVGPHRSHHAYRIISSHAFPIFTNDWGADEELLLIEGAEMYGLGSWADMAEHVGGRTKEECERHYMDTYVWSTEYPLPTIASDLSDDQEAFQKRKKARLQELQSRPVPLPPPKPMASAPTCHEIGGFMPGRLEFETEYENEAELLIKDLEFGKVYAFGGAAQPASLEEVQAIEGGRKVPVVEDKEATGTEENEKDNKEDEAGSEARVVEETAAQADEEPKLIKGEATEEADVVEAEPEAEVEAEEPTSTADKTTKDDETPLMGQAPGNEAQEDLELKLTLLDMFNERYDKRMAAKELIADRGLINYKQIVVNERKRTKEERDLILRAKPYAKIQTALDHETFVDGLLHEAALRKRISELQEYRRMGVTSIADGERYEHAKAQRAARLGYRDPLGHLSRSRNGILSATPTIFKPAISGAPSRPPTSTPPALTLASASSLHLLTVLEQQLCSTLRILPKPYLFLKETLLREWARRGAQMTSREARDFIVKKPKLPSSFVMGEDGTMAVVEGEEEDVTMQNGIEVEDEWGEKVERVFEFLVDTGSLNAKEAAGVAHEVNGSSVPNGMMSDLRPTAATLDVIMSNGDGGTEHIQSSQ